MGFIRRRRVFQTQTRLSELHCRRLDDLVWYVGRVYFVYAILNTFGIVDQDDSSYSALNVYTCVPPTHSHICAGANQHPFFQPDIDQNNASSTLSSQCKTTGCGESCPDGWNTLTFLTTPEGTSCPANNRARLCCPRVSTGSTCSRQGLMTFCRRLCLRTVVGLEEEAALAMASVVSARSRSHSIRQASRAGQRA
jgi:hypothetical protein